MTNSNLFVTCRIPKEGPTVEIVPNRTVSFDPQETDISRKLLFCRRIAKDKYVEIGHEVFFNELKKLAVSTQVLFYIHGFNNNMEPDIFNNTQSLQEQFDSLEPQKVEVIPLIWPCDDDSVLAFADDYWDDQQAADFSAPAFTRMISFFKSWQRKQLENDKPCIKAINVMAHSMGNRVLMQTLAHTASLHNGQTQQLFRNTFMVAADVENEVLERGELGESIVDASKNVTVYFANDDWSMPASKVANLKNRTLSRRMGLTGPESMKRVGKRVYEVDCDEFNNQIDLKGHSYFHRYKNGDISPLVKHMYLAIKTGRVTPDKRSHILTEECLEID